MDSALTLNNTAPGTFSFRRLLPVLIHLLVWATVGLTLLVMHPLSWNVTLPYQFWMMQGIYLLVFVGLYYFNAYVLVPRFLFRNRPLVFLVLCLASAFTAVWGLEAIHTALNLPELMHELFSNKPRVRRNGGRNFFHLLRGPLNFFNILLVLCVSTSIAAVKKWREDARLRHTLEQQKVSSELSFLKAQINPHFFFNTLNNIYALTMFDVEASRQALLTLSRMMRYVLYDTQNDHALLSKELDFIRDYINLMQLRLTDKVRVTFDYPEPLQDLPVAPMLLLPFVENAFKHGIHATRPSEIGIALRQQDSILEIEVTNPVFEENVNNLEGGSGIGLANTRRRLDLMYPGRYTLEVTGGAPGTDFRVYLKLNLS